MQVSSNPLSTQTSVADKVKPSQTVSDKEQRNLKADLSTSDTVKISDEAKAKLAAEKDNGGGEEPPKKVRAQNGGGEEPSRVRAQNGGGEEPSRVRAQNGGGEEPSI